MTHSAPLKGDAKLIHGLSERIVKAQKPIRILDAIKWDESVEHAFFAKNAEHLPHVDERYYDRNPLSFDPALLRQEFYGIERDIKCTLGQYSDVGNIMLRMCREYRMVLRLLESRGTSEFGQISQELYGSSKDAFYAGGPNINELVATLGDVLLNLHLKTISELDEKRYNAQEAVKKLQEELDPYFAMGDTRVKVVISDGIVSDASAGADTIRIREKAMFSERDLRLLRVHEGWVHIGTTLNGRQQPVCTFLSKGPPSSTVTQEGLAVIMELFTFSAFPSRLSKIINRIHAIDMADEGADFLDVYRFFLNANLEPKEAYSNTVRVFRGSVPNGKAFTKDLAYGKGFILIYNYIRLAIRQGLVERIPLLFLGKTNLEDLAVYQDLMERKLITPPTLVPAQFKDIAALSAWMSFSLFLNKIDVDRLCQDYKHFL